MDNKQAIEELNKLIPNNPDYNDKNIALTMAIASLEAWDKVKEDVKHSQFMFLSGDKEVECIPIFVVMNIINRNLGGE